MNCRPDVLARAAIGFTGLPNNRLLAAQIYALCAWANAAAGPVPPPVTPTTVILSNGAGGFCRLVVDILGNVGAVADAGPATATVVLADGSGGFWEIITDGTCNRGTTSVAGPATVAPVLTDLNSVSWTLVCDNLGNLGATS